MRYLILLLMMLSGVAGKAQNLLANGSFEDENICTEFIKNCAPEAWICTSLISDYYVYEPYYSYWGSHFVGLIVGNDRKKNSRSFVRSKLLCGLRKGKQYQVEFYCRSRHNVTDSLGIYFSTTDFLFDTRSYKDITPSVWILDSTQAPITTKSSWVKRSVIYTATGDEVFISIGSFKRLEHRFSAVPDRGLDYYLYIDSIGMKPLDEHEKICACADSVKTTLYDENERHTLLEKKRYVYRKAPPTGIPAPVTVVQRIDTLVIPDVLFATASAKLDKRSFSVLDSFATALSIRNIDSLVFEGHTDSIGTLAANQKLSADRATAVADYLQQKNGFPTAKRIIRYYAYLKPVTSNHTPQGRQRNRRVEIYLYTHE